MILLQSTSLALSPPWSRSRCVDTAISHCIGTVTSVDQVPCVDTAIDHFIGTVTSMKQVSLRRCIDTAIGHCTGTVTYMDQVPCASTQPSTTLSAPSHLCF